MKINEINPGTQVSMSFIVDGKDTRIFGNVVENTMMEDLFGMLADFQAAMVPACLIKIEDAKLLGDGQDYVADTLLAPKEFVTYLWECVDGRLFQKDGESYLYMTTQKYGLQFNRRGNLRIRLDKKSEIHFHQNDVHDILIKDVSEGGIGFYLSKDVKLQIGEHCVIGLEDLEDDSEGIPSKFIESNQIEAEIVRIAEAENDLLLYGCIII